MGPQCQPENWGCGLECVSNASQCGLTLAQPYGSDLLGGPSGTALTTWVRESTGLSCVLQRPGSPAVIYTGPLGSALYRCTPSTCMRLTQYHQ